MATLNCFHLSLILCSISAMEVSSKLTEPAEISADFLTYAKSAELLDWMVGIWRRIHENPELGFEEFEASEIVRTELDRLGIEYKYPVATTGVFGFIGTGSGPFVAIEADKDALAMQLCLAVLFSFFRFLCVWIFIRLV